MRASQSAEGTPLSQFAALPQAPPSGFVHEVVPDEQLAADAEGAATAKRTQATATTSWTGFRMCATDQDPETLYIGRTSRWLLRYAASLSPGCDCMPSSPDSPVRTR